MDGFYEWRRSDRTPLRIRFKKRPIFPLAGLYDTWHGPDGEKVSGCTVITCESNFFMSVIHDRMPVVLDDEGVDIWLDKSETRKDVLQGMLKPCDDTDMYSYEVDKMVGNVRNDSRKCIEPVTK